MKTPRRVLRLAVVLAVMAAVATYGCLPPDRPTPRPNGDVKAEQERAGAATVRDARRAAARGDHEGNERLLRLTITRYPDTEAADEARLELGLAAHHEERWDDAQSLLGALRHPPQDPGARYRWRTALADLEQRRGRSEEAAEHLDALVQEGSARPEQRRQLAEILVTGSEPEKALEALTPPETAPAEERSEARASLREILGERPTAELDTLAERTTPEEPAGTLVRLTLAERLLDAGSVEQAEETLAPLTEQPLEPTDGESLADLLARIEAVRSIDDRAVGVLLPLSGKYAKVGGAARVAIEAAAAASPDVRLVFRDTAGTPDGAAEAVRALVEDDHVVAAIGPIGYRESGSAAERAEELGLPLLPLSARPDIHTDRAMVLRCMLTRETEGRALARWAVTNLGTLRFGAFHADNGYGHELVDAFRAELERLGAQFVGSAAYEPGATDLRKPLSTLLGRRVPAKDELKPSELPFDALLVADGARGARRVAPYLKFARVPLRLRPELPGVLLLGGGAWNTPAIVDPAEGLTDNAVFTAGFYSDGEDPVVSAFLRRFYEQHGQRPSTFQAEAYDAAAMLFETVLSASGLDRATLREALGSVRNRVGVTGVWTVLPDGRVRRSVRILTIDGQDIRPRLSEEEEQELRRLKMPAF